MHTRRQSRGYVWEKTIVKYFSSDGWFARRVGSATSDMPDIIITNNEKDILWAIEAKSTFSDTVYIDNEQIIRCKIILDMFANYKKRYIVFAFKFSANKEKGRDKLHYYFFKVTKLENLNNIEWVKCFYDGRLRYKLVSNDVKAELKVIQYEKLSDLKDNVIVTKLVV